MVVMNEVVIMALKNNHVIRIDLRNPNKIEDIELSIKSSDTVHRLFLDESGQHLLIALVSADTLYLHSSAHKTKPVTKLKGHLVEAVAFDKHYTDAQSSGSGNPSTKIHNGVQALIATSKGHVYESEIEAVEARFFQGNSVDKYMRLVHMVPNEECIKGLMLSAFADESQPALITPKSSSGSHSGAEDVKYLLVVTTANRMYEFIGYKRTDAPIWKRLFMEEDGGLLKGLGTSLAHGSRGTGSISRGPHTVEAKHLVKSLQTDQPTTVSSPKQTKDGVKSPTKTRMPPSLDRLIVESASASSLTEASGSSSPKRGSTSTTPSSSRQNANKYNVSSLLVHYKYSGVPTSLAWVSARSVYLANVVFGTHSMGESVCGSDAAVIALDHKREPAERRNTSASPRITRTIPSSFALTEFHVIRLDSDNRVTVYCVLDQEVVYTTTYAQSEYGRLTGLTRDVEKDTIWVFGPDGIHELLFNDETRSVWKIYLARNQFATALEYSRDKPEITDYIHSQQGNYYFDQCKYILAAQSYAKSSHVALEEIALKLMDIDQYEALQEYISRRLDNLKPDQKAQATMLTMWLIELYLSQLDRCVDRGDDDTQLQSQLRQFLTKPVVKQNLSANHTAVYNLICSHGRIEDGVFYANHMGDYERVVSHHIACHDYEAALEVLALQSNLSLYYNFSSQLLMNAPQLAVDSWLKQPKLDPRRLVPAVAIYTKKYPNISIQENQALRYLEKVITELGVQDPAIQNCLISVYVSYNADEKLIDFLQTSSGYDRQYVLRLCFESNKLHACVEIYKQMGLYEEAVTLALKVDVELAKDITELPDEDDESLRKRLWLKIAHHVIEEDHNIERAMKLLEEQSDLVKIEDILPFFPEFVKIDHFKVGLYLFCEHTGFGVGLA
ncbi:hypothetical protein SARC_06412 [Sphaeroforma arctica JP610]|uniref:Pep3/Vps18 beta-propeller domain-containing protein n=1 Tax=Sphaeroforma arctica JP610 TaxID=667725 RepID=A0A0L0FWP2_9EUKA|nr:hypothetical protein SARC_06412 [Sphaeroforma arctica JP610]KNC81237.1 hypothetical protein SARC_06412 [Sphaeroforma arctica JP610]|eukprot:XP_014155139.1 hypothetical protein SARC_06412 [Sphaeroforma arctica JP610]